VRVVLVAAGLAGCFPQPSGSYTCKTTLECDPGRVCDHGFCVVGVADDARVDTGVDAPSGVGFVDVASGGASTTTTVATSTSVTAAAGQQYLAIVSTKHGTGAIAVTAVTGLGLTWTPVKAQCSGRGTTDVTVWSANGSPSATGPVTATLDQTVDAAVIAVARYAGVTVGASTSDNTVGVAGGCLGGGDTVPYAISLTTTASASFAFVAVAIRNESNTAILPFHEQFELGQDTGGTRAAVAGEDAFVGSPTTIVANGMLGTSNDWAAVAVELAVP
jgi:hypothetical protein